MQDRIRHLRFAPYFPGMGPTYSLTLWDTGRRDWRGQSYLAYRLTERAPGAKRARVLFHGDDFAGSPLNADDSDATAESLMGFLCLRPGDTDAEYFEGYTPAQREFCELHAETLGFEALERLAAREG